MPHKYHDEMVSDFPWEREESKDTHSNCFYSTLYWSLDSDAEQEKD